MPLEVYTRTQEHNENIKKTLNSPEIKKKISNSQKERFKNSKGTFLGKKHTKNSKKKMSDALKGRISWNKGLKNWMSEEGKARMIESKIGHIPWNKGKHITYNSGEKNNNWKGGITPINEKIRKSLEYKLWRKAIFERDNYTCQKTGISGGRLVVHHINNFADFPELRFAIDNGITLLVKAHKEFHQLYGKRNNTREQIKEFLR